MTEKELISSLNNDRIKANDKNLIYKSIEHKIQLQQQQQEENESINFEEEEIIAEDFFNFIDDEELLKLPVYFLYKVLNNPKMKINEMNESEQFKVIDFMFKCLKYHQKEASVLFLKLDFGNQFIGLISRLINENSNLLDFRMIDPTFLLKSLTFLLNENEQLKHLNKILENEDENILICNFNELSLSIQNKVIKKLLESNSCQNKLFFTALNHLITYLNQYCNPIESYLEISTCNKTERLLDIKNDCQVKLRYHCLEKLFENNEFDSTELINILTKFNDVYLQLRYPHPLFQQIYDHLLLILRGHEKRIKIGVFISGKNKTDNQFRNDQIISIVELDSTITEISGDEFNDFTKSGGGSFCLCKSLERITMSPSVVFIGKRKFYGCSFLTQIKIPSSVVSIGSNAFSRCSSLTQISIPSSVTSIGVCAFRGCSSLKEITIPSSIYMIDDYVFYGCSSLTQISIPPSVTSLGTASFYNCLSLKKISIPSSVIEIKGRAFEECSSLDQVSIPSSVTYIGGHAFYKCRSLTQITLPSFITMGSNAIPPKTKVIRK